MESDIGLRVLVNKTNLAMTRTHSAAQHNERNATHTSVEPARFQDRTMATVVEKDRGLRLHLDSIGRRSCQHPDTKLTDFTARFGEKIGFKRADAEAAPR